MCNIYCSTESSLYESESRSIRIQGCVTSLRLEQEFWRILEQIAKSENTTLPRFVNTLYAELLEKKGEVKNFSSFLRVACTVYTTQVMPGFSDQLAAEL